MRQFISSVATVLLLAACGKTKYDTGNVYGGLSFYNASQVLDVYLPSGYGKRVLLPLTPEGGRTVPLTGSAIPNFTSGISGARYDFPAINAGNAVPWTVFDHYSPGTYKADVFFNTTDSARQFSCPVVVEAGRQSVCILSDSLGVFHATAVVHEQKEGANGIRLCLVQVCPDGDSINLRIGSNLVSGVQNMGYQAVSGYLDYPLKSDSTLKLRIFRAADTLNVLARMDLQAQPGQSYMLILKNYMKNHTYTDKNGKTVTIAPNAAIDVRR